MQGMGERLWRSCIPTASACAVWLLLRSTEQRRGDTAQAICFLTGNLFFCGRVGHSLSLGTWQKDGGNGAEQTASLPSLCHVASSWILLRHRRNFRAGRALSSPPFLLHSKICFRIWMTTGDQSNLVSPSKRRINSFHFWDGKHPCLIAT